MRFEHLDLEQLSPNQREIAEYLVQYANRVPYLSIEEIAEDIGTSTATVSRFVRTAGFSGFKELKGAIRADMETSPRGKVAGTLSRIGDDDIFGGVAAREIAHLERTIDLLDRTALDRVVQAISDAETVCVYGNGPASSVAQLLAFRLNRYRKHVHVLGRDTSTMAEALIHLGPNSVLIAFAFQKDRPKLERVFTLARDAGTPSVLITDMRVSRTSEYCDIVLSVDRGGPAEFHSMVVPIALVDAIVLTMARRIPETTNDALERIHELKRSIDGE